MQKCRTHAHCVRDISHHRGSEFGWETCSSSLLPPTPLHPTHRLLPFVAASNNRWTTTTRPLRTQGQGRGQVLSSWRGCLASYVHSSSMTKNTRFHWRISNRSLRHPMSRVPLTTKGVFNTPPRRPHENSLVFLERCLSCFSCREAERRHRQERQQSLCRADGARKSPRHIVVGHKLCILL